MENATLQPLNEAAAAAAGPANLWSRLMALPLPRKLMLAGGLLALVGILVAALTMGRADDYKVLFTNLSDKDGGAIIAQLSQMNVPYKYTEGGSAILVPTQHVHDVRLKLAQAGLPKGGTIGFELMDTARFGTTQFQERLNFQRGLEGELVRSITSMAAVEAARVHLALPQQNGFFREQQKPSASVLLTLHPGRTLDKAQIAGIVHLVASSVPELNPKAVSILDQTGALLSGPDEGMARAEGLDAQQLQYVNSLERNYTKRVMDLLEPVVGRDNLRAQVTADIDFTQTEQTSEEFKPNQGNEPAAVRSAQTSEQSNTNAAQPSGVPGAASNQPPGPTTAPVNGSAAPLQAGNGNGNGANGGNSKREAVTNYEVDKTVRVTRGSTGMIRRLTAAVVVNHRSTTDKKGNTQSVAPTQEELDKLTALVQEAVGFSKDRGDSVRVIAAPFQIEKPVVEDVPLWKQPEVRETVHTLGWPLGLALLAAIVVFGAIRPALKQGKPEPVRLEAVVDEGAELPALNADGSPVIAGEGATAALPAPEEPKVDEGQLRLESARRIASENPAAVANILRGWITNGA